MFKNFGPSVRIVICIDASVLQVEVPLVEVAWLFMYCIRILMVDVHALYALNWRVTHENPGNFPRGREKY